MKKNYVVSFSARNINCCQILLLTFIFILLSSNLFAQDPIRVAGTVRDSKGAGIAGISVMIKGTSSGTVTDTTGAYSINVPSPQSVLVFTGVGFIERSETIKDRKMINVTLADRASDLNEVVVIGYGQTLKKSDVGGAISSVNAKQIAERQPITC